MKDVLHAVCTVMMLYPGLAIFLVVVVFNMLGDSIRDILDPRDE